LRKLLESLVSIIVSTIGVVRRIIDQSNTLEPLREVGRPKGLCAVKGHPIPWVVEVMGNREELGLWGCCVWRVLKYCNWEEYSNCN
jgi:hypothetical protein